jgi:hypothetical protein
MRLATLALALALAAGAGTARAQASACASLDAPFSAEVHEFARVVIEGMHAENRPDLVREYVHLQGWPTATRGNWAFQYPPTWTLRDSGMLHGWVSDARDASHMLFVIQETTQGNPTVDELFYALVNATIGPRTPCDRVTFVASDTTRRWYLAGAQDDVGMVYAWVFRWVDARYGPMIASLKLDLQARGVYTAYGYVLTSAPEAELGTAVREAFGPMAATFDGDVGGTDRDDKPKKKGDGDDDDEDDDED